MRLHKIVICILAAPLIFSGCKNRPINEGEAFKPKERHENITFHCDPIEVDGVDYLILERDNNNPHEGFGFMAFRANELLMKQDSLMAYLKTVNQMQSLIYAQLTDLTPEEAQALTDQLLHQNLNGYPIGNLESENFVSIRTRRRPEDKKAGSEKD